MNNKRRNSELSSIPYEKRPRRTYSLEEKLEIIKLSENGERNCDISRAFGIRESTLRTICSQADKIKATYNKLSLPSTSQTGVNLMDVMENQLLSWINEQNNNNIEVNTIMIRERAIRIYNELKISNNGVQGRPFVASDGWLERFKKRANLLNNNNKINNQIIINEFPAILKKIIDEDGYLSKQVFCIDETELYWKRIPCDDNLIKNNHEILKDRLSLLFCMNAYGDYRLKPLVVYHIANPKILDGYSKDHLPVVWRSNPQAKITTNIFIDYFCNRLTNELKDYCLNESIPFKILLILSNTLSIQSSYLMDLSENIRVVFLPNNNNNTTINPMKQGVISAFKAHYVRHIYLKLIEIIDDDNHQQQLDLTQFWLNFTIKNSIDLINQSWYDINSTYLNRSWRTLWPECVHDYKLIDLIDDLLETKKQITILIKEIGFKNITNINEFISNNNNNDDNYKQIIKDDDDRSSSSPQLRTLTVDMLNEAFDNIQNAIQIFDEYDPDRERSSKIIKNIDNAIQCYKQIYYEKKRKAKQLITTTTISNQVLLPISGAIKIEDCQDN